MSIKFVRREQTEILNVITEKNLSEIFYMVADSLLRFVHLLRAPKYVKASTCISMDEERIESLVEIIPVIQHSQFPEDVIKLPKSYVTHTHTKEKFHTYVRTSIGISYACSYVIIYHPTLPCYTAGAAA